MSNYIMNVDFFGNTVRCETSGNLVCLNDLVTAGNAWRVNRGLSMRKLQDITQTDTFKNFISATSDLKGIPPEELYYISGKGRTARTMGHLIIAVYVAEQMSPWFHAKVIDTFLEGKLLEYRELGGTEFKNLNAAIDLYLPDLNGKDSRTAYVICANIIRHKLLGEEAQPGSWDKASVAQTHSRYELEKAVTKMLSMGVVKDLNHLRQILKAF